MCEKNIKKVAAKFGRYIRNIYLCSVNKKNNGEIAQLVRAHDS